MTIETIVSAKSLWFLELRNINPRGRNLYRMIVPKLEQWYGFTPPKEFDEEHGVRFTGGEFTPSTRADDLTGIEVTVYNNGMVAMSTTSTDDTDKFIETVLTRLAGEGIISYRPEMIRKKQYASEVIARSDKQLALPQLEPIYEMLSKSVYRATSTMLWSGLVIDADPLASGKQVPFKFERSARASFDENLWYSHGPVSTTQHQIILDAIEESLAA